MKLFFRYIRSFFINLKILGLKKAIKFPILYSNHTKLKGIYKNCILINTKLKRGMIQIGKGGKNILEFNKKSKLIFKGNAIVGDNFKIILDNDSILIIEDNLKIKDNLTLKCNGRITINRNVRIEDNVIIDNQNNYLIYSLNEENKEAKQIIIDDNVLIKSNSVILNLSYVPKNSVIQEGSIVSKEFINTNAIYAGNPAKLVKENIIWKENKNGYNNI